MKVRELLAGLQQVDPEAVVLFLDVYADPSESDEVCEVFAPTNKWTHERGRFGTEEYDVRYPDAPEPRPDGYCDVTFVEERVVVLSAGPTNLRFWPR